MSNKKSNVSDKASEIAKNIWLAGVGAYGKAADEAHERIEKAGIETPKLFRDLVKAGTALEEGAREGLKSGKLASKSSVEERINKVRENFNFQRSGRGDEIAELQRKVDLISKKLDLLATALTDSGVISVPRKVTKASAKKKSPAKKAAKAAPRKPTAKKNPAAKARSVGRKTKA
ncbi:MAG: hypothetical protein ACI8QT_001390 [Halioglobus sp.]|jgi:hypothetical protein